MEHFSECLLSLRFLWMSDFHSAFLRANIKETATCRLTSALDLGERTHRQSVRRYKGSRSPGAKLTAQFFHPLTSLSTWWVGCRHRGVTLVCAITPLLGTDDASQPQILFPLIQQEQICCKDK